MSAIQPVKWNGEPISSAGIFSDVAMSAYHGPRLCIGPSVSSSGLRKIFMASPMEFWVEAAINPNRIEKRDSEAFILGRAAHHLFLGEADFRKHFSFRPDEFPDWRTKAARDWRANETLSGRSVLDPKQVEIIQGMGGLLPWQKGLRDSGIRNTALVVNSGLLSGWIEQSIVWQDRETGVWLKARPDAIPSDSGLFSDFKTTTSIDDRSIRSTLDEYRYDMQAALIRRGAREVLGIEMQGFVLVFAEKTPPFGVRVVELKPDDLEEGEKDIQTAIRVLAHCLETGRWFGPGGTQTDAVYIGRSDWSRKWSEMRRSFLEGEIAA